VGVFSGDQVADQSQSGSVDGVVFVEEKLHDRLANSAVDECVDFEVVAFGQVRESPAGVADDVDVAVVEKLNQGGNCVTNGFKVRFWFSAAEVGDRPNGVASESGFDVILCEEEEFWKDLQVEHVVSARRRVSRDVSECPDDLFSDQGVISCGQNLCKNIHSSVVEKYNGLF